MIAASVACAAAPASAADAASCSVLVDAETTSALNKALPIYFRPGSNNLTQAAEALLDRLVENVIDGPAEAQRFIQPAVELQNAETPAADASGETLSVERALAVERYLTTLGVEPNAIKRGRCSKPTQQTVSSPAILKRRAIVIIHG